MGTRETMLAPTRRGPRKKLLWPWIILAVGLAFGLVTGVGLAARFVIGRLG